MVIRFPRGDLAGKPRDRMSGLSGPDGAGGSGWRSLDGLRQRLSNRIRGTRANVARANVPGCPAAEIGRGVIDWF
jgi:hypothetical protein